MFVLNPLEELEDTVLQWSHHKVHNSRPEHWSWGQSSQEQCSSSICRVGSCNFLQSQVSPADFLEDKLGEDWKSAAVHCVGNHAPLKSLNWSSRSKENWEPDSCSASSRHFSSTASSPSRQALFQVQWPSFLKIYFALQIFFFSYLKKLVVILDHLPQKVEILN